MSVAVGLALSACAVGPDFHAPDAPKVADASHPYTPAPLPAMAGQRREPGVRAAALRRRPGHLRHLVGGVPVAGAQRAGAVGARAQPHRGGRPGHTAPGRGELPRRLRLEGVPVGHRQPERRAPALRAGAGRADPGRLHRQPVPGRARPVVHAGHRGRQPPRARRRARGHRLPALPGRGHVAEPDVQRGGHGDPGGLAARAAARSRRTWWTTPTSRSR